MRSFSSREPWVTLRDVFFRLMPSLMTQPCCTEVPTRFLLSAKFSFSLFPGQCWIKMLSPRFWASHFQLSYGLVPFTQHIISSNMLLKNCFIYGHFFLTIKIRHAGTCLLISSHLLSLSDSVSPQQSTYYQLSFLKIQISSMMFGNLLLSYGSQLQVLWSSHCCLLRTFNTKIIEMIRTCHWKS